MRPVGRERQHFDAGWQVVVEQPVVPVDRLVARVGGRQPRDGARDPVALAEALEYLLNRPNLRYRMGEAARQFVIERFSEDEVSARLVEEYGRLLTQGASSAEAKTAVPK